MIGGGYSTYPVDRLSQGWNSPVLEIEKEKTMTFENSENFETQDQTPISNTNQPDWIVKGPRGYGRNSYLERIGAAWNRDDGGIGIRLTGKQVIEDHIYLYPNQPQD